MLARSAPIALALLVASNVARADEAPASPDKAPSDQAPRVHVDAAPAVVLPMGNLADATGPGIGGLLGGSYSFDSRWEIVGHAGYLAGASTSSQLAGLSVSSSLSYAPLLGGVRYYFSDPAFARLYAMAEAGAVLVSGSSTAATGNSAASGSDSSVYLGSAVSLGVQLDVMDLRAGLLTADLGHAGASTSGLMTVGFRFAAF